MVETNNYVDPRALVSHPIVSGQVYEDDRSGDEYRIIYADSSIVLLREDNDGRDGHLLSDRGQFEENVGSDRFKLVEPGDESPRMPDDFESIRALIHRKHDEYSSLGTRTGTHKAEGMAEFAAEFEKLAEDDPEPIDFESISGIGAKAAQNLRDAGFRTALDVQQADPERIKSIDLMGESNTENLLDAVEGGT